MHRERSDPFLNESEILMSEANSASDPRAPGQKLVQELKVSGHLMNLDAGLFCVVQTPSKAGEPSQGLPGVRISLPPGVASRPDAVSIKSFRDDGWLHRNGDAALVRVEGGPAQILVTVYQAPGVQDAAPNIQVLRLIDADPTQIAQPAQTAALPPAPVPAVAGPPVVMDMVAHIQGRGDVGGLIGDWLGDRGSKRWIEGFALAPLKDVAPSEIEYQAVLGRGWLSPWVEGGQFCGSRGMALPILGLRVRLKGAAAEKFDCSYSASFVDGTASPMVAAGEPCEAESLAAVEAFRVVIAAKGQPAETPAQAAKPAAVASRAKAAPARKPARSAKAR
jgi:hypothetical protein